MMEGWTPLRRDSLPTEDRPLEVCTEHYPEPLPYSVASCHRYIAFYGDSETMLWRYAAPKLENSELKENQC